MLSAERNEMLTRVSAGTPAGELLRRYWHPVAVAGELTSEKPIKAVKLLGENLVVFRLPPERTEGQPRYGLVAEQCRHRLASLAYGRVDVEGIRCPYHGWKYDLGGRCLEQPAERGDGGQKGKIRQPAYPVQKLGGLLFAYLGPSPAPLLPRWDVLAREDGRRWVVVDSVINCNWLQIMENSVDPAHFYWLHGSLSAPGILGPRQMNQYEEEYEFNPCQHGIMKRRITPGRNAGDPPMIDEHPLVFPTTLRLDIDLRGTDQVRHVLQMRVPMDDTHTWHFSVNFLASKTERSPADSDAPYELCPIRKPDGEYNMDLVLAQDAMAWETQGPITDRTQEHLGTSDRGIVMLRRLLRDQIEAVQRGEDPLGVIRDPAKNTIIEFDTRQDRLGLESSLMDKQAV